MGKLSGLAQEAIITSAMDGLMNKEYSLHWYSTSRTPVTEFKVSIKKVDKHDWDTYDVEAETPDEGDDYHGHLHLSDLQEASLYQVKVASRNMFGFNQPGEAFTFGTKGADAENKHSAMTAPAAGASTMPKPTMSIVIILIAIRMVVGR